MKKLLFVLFVFLYSQTAWATAQAPDWIVYQDTEYMLFSNPMEEYFNKHPDARPENESHATNLWRGYIAKFKIENKKLYLSDVIVYKYVPENPSSPKSGEASGTSNGATTIQKDPTSLKRIEVSAISKVFPNQDDRFLSWYSGLLVLPYGGQVNYVHMGYAGTYEHYIVLEIKDGILTKQREFNHDDYETFKKRQFTEFKKTEKYKKLLEEVLKNGGDEKSAEKFLSIVVIEYSSKFLFDLP